MLAIPTALQSKFDEQLQIRAVPIALHELYKKWLLYYLDFCRKYKFPPRQEKSLPPFLKKLQDKQQSKMQQEQAAAAATQNQAFNSLLFFYRHVLRKEFGKVDGVVRAKRKP